jgi:hypothetical protein
MRVESALAAGQERRAAAANHGAHGVFGDGFGGFTPRVKPAGTCEQPANGLRAKAIATAGVLHECAMSSWPISLAVAGPRRVRAATTWTWMLQWTRKDQIKMNNGTKPPSHELPEATAQGPVAEGTAYNANA